MNEIIKYIKANGGFASTKELNQAKFYSREIKRSLQQGEIEKIKKGFYRISNFSFFKDVNVSLITVCRAEPKAIISLISALDYYEMTDINPSKIYYSIPHSLKKKELFTPPVNLFYFRERFYNLGINKIKTKYGYLKIYNKEKTICDMFRYRNTLGEDLAMQALKNYLNQKDKSIATLIKYAELCQVKTVIIPLLKGMIF